MPGLHPPGTPGLPGNRVHHQRLLPGQPRVVRPHGLHDARLVDPQVLAWLRATDRIHQPGPGCVSLTGRAATKKGILAVIASGNSFNTGDRQRYCACPERMVYPSGTVRECSCVDAPVLGNVLLGPLQVREGIHGCWKTRRRGEPHAGNVLPGETQEGTPL